MINDIKKNFGLVKVLLILSIIAVGSYVFTLFWSVLLSVLDLLMVLLISWLLSFILEPLVVYIKQVTKTTKVAASGISYLLVSLLIFGFGYVCIPLISHQIPYLLEIIPAYLNTAPKFMTDFNSSLMTQLGSSVNVLPSIASFFLSAFTVMVLSFYMIVDRKKINQEIINVIPEEWRDFYIFFEKVINDTFITFLRVQFFYALVAVVTTWLVFVVLGIDYGVSVAFISGFFTVVPLIGPVLAMAISVLVALSAGSWQAIVVGVYLFIAQQITFNVVGPKLLGRELKIHPGIVLFSFVVGLKFGGALGAFFAIPVLGISMFMLRRFGHHLVNFGKSRQERLEDE